MTVPSPVPTLSPCCKDLVSPQPSSCPDQDHAPLFTVPLTSICLLPRSLLILTLILGVGLPVLTYKETPSDSKASDFHGLLCHGRAATVTELGGEWKSLGCKLPLFLPKAQ